MLAYFLFDAPKPVCFLTPKALSSSRSMSRTTPLFQETSLDPETTAILWQAFELARKSLHDRGQPHLIQQIIAQRIIAAVKQGERDPQKLCETALTALGNKAVFER
jgi:hypothetical protein